MPLIGLFYLYLHREALRSATIRPAWTGLPVLLGGIALSLAAIWPGQNEYLQDVGMLVALAGAVLLGLGWRVLRVTWFPILFLICAIPWPETFYNWACTPLQNLAAGGAVKFLNWVALDARKIGTKIYIFDGAKLPRILNVAEACSGLRALGTFVTVAAAVAILNRRPRWQKILITCAAVPVAVVCNVARVAGQALLDHYAGPRVTEGSYHTLGGSFMYLVGFVLIITVAWVLDHLFIPEQKPGPADAGATGSSSAGAVKNSTADSWGSARSEIRASASPVRARHRGGRDTAGNQRSVLTYAVLVSVLAVSAGGLSAATHLLRLTFEKLPIPLARPLDTLPAALGSWQQVGADVVLDAALEESLGTRQYVMRNYVDARQVDAVVLRRMQSAPPADQARLLLKIIAERPAAVVNLKVTYYTGTVEKLSHTPEVCYFADGYQPSQSRVVQWLVAGKPLDVRYLEFEDQNRSQRPTCNVAYTFHVNGHYESDSWAVRCQLQSPFIRRNYFTKIEVVIHLADRRRCAEVMQEFLTLATPEIEHCLPDWNAVSRANGP